MASTQIEIRRLEPPDARVYREIRLEALRLAPEAFSSSFEAECTQPVDWFASRLGKSITFGAFRAAELVGTAGLVLSDRQKEAHKGTMVGMYVRLDARRAGVGRRLVETIIEFARGRVEQVQLAVVSDNTAALRLYERLGFMQYGLEKKALKQAGRYYDEIRMAKDLVST
jgi:ribosomal protein S18 acetylase RimI-like enzyme